MSLDSEQIEDEEFYNKRIALKILRFRSKPRKDLEAEEFKHASIKDMASSGQVANFRQKCQATHSSLVSRGSDRPSQSIKQKMSDVHNNATVENHYFLTKVVNMKETEIEHQKLRDLEFPQNA